MHRQKPKEKKTNNSNNKKNYNKNVSFLKEAFRWKTLTAVTCRKRSVVGWFWERGGEGFLSFNGAKGKINCLTPKTLSVLWPSSGESGIDLPLLPCGSLYMS